MSFIRTRALTYNEERFPRCFIGTIINLKLIKLARLLIFCFSHRGFGSAWASPRLRTTERFFNDTGGGLAPTRRPPPQIVNRVFASLRPNAKRAKLAPPCLVAKYNLTAFPAEFRAVKLSPSRAREYVIPRACTHVRRCRCLPTHVATFSLAAVHNITLVLRRARRGGTRRAYTRRASPRFCLRAVSFSDAATSYTASRYFSPVIFHRHYYLLGSCRSFQTFSLVLPAHGGPTRAHTHALRYAFLYLNSRYFSTTCCATRRDPFEKACNLSYIMSRCTHDKINYREQK